MGKIKNIFKEIANHVEFLREVEIKNGDRLSVMLAKMQEELVRMNTLLEGLLEKLEEQQTAGQDAQLLRVMPAENAGKEALFVVTGDELANLLTACRGAVLKMKGEQHENE